MCDGKGVLYAGKLNEIVVPDCRGNRIAPGDTVILRNPHPHAGQRGVYRGVERTLAGWMCLVKFDDDGDGCYVSHQMQWSREEL